MWQLLLAAAVAGSGILARRLYRDGDPIAGCVKERTEKCEQKEEEKVDQVVEVAEEQEPVGPVEPEVSMSGLSSSPLIPSGFSEVCESSFERRSSAIGEERIFRFSSLGGEGGIEFRSGSKSSRKKVGFGSSGLKRNVDGVKRRVGSEKFEKKSSSLGGDGVIVEDPRKKGRRYFICLKRRRTNATGRCGSFSSKGNSSFSWGLGVGIMYMISAGKTEINKLNTAVDEAAKVIQELKTELYKRKSSCNLRDSSGNSKVDAYPRKFRGKHEQPVIAKSGAKQEDSDYTKVLALPPSDDVECASSVLTEEPEPEVLEMDQLEAELESELQKIPWCISEEASHHEGRMSGLGELEPEHYLDAANIELLAHGLPGPHKPEGMDSDSYQFHGVLPSELDQKLCHLLIEQQETQILDLESELQSAQTKLHEKEAELQALKDCVRHLTDLSLETASDEETEESETLTIGRERDSCADSSISARLLVDGANKVEQKSVIGMKRVMEFQSCDCHL